MRKKNFVNAYYVCYSNCEKTKDTVFFGSGLIYSRKRDKLSEKIRKNGLPLTTKTLSEVITKLVEQNEEGQIVFVLNFNSYNNINEILPLTEKEVKLLAKYRKQQISKIKEELPKCLR